RRRAVRLRSARWPLGLRRAARGPARRRSAAAHPHQRPPPRRGPVHARRRVRRVPREAHDAARGRAPLPRPPPRAPGHRVRDAPLRRKISKKRGPRAREARPGWRAAARLLLALALVVALGGSLRVGLLVAGLRVLLLVAFLGVAFRAGGGARGGLGGVLRGLGFRLAGRADGDD